MNLKQTVRAIASDSGPKWVLIYVRIRGRKLGNCFVWPFGIASPILCPFLPTTSFPWAARAALPLPLRHATPSLEENNALKWQEMTEGQRKALIESKRQYCEGLKQMVYERLLSTCECGSKNRLRLRFRDPKHPMKHRFTRHPETLHSLMLKDANFFAQLALFCGQCRLRQHYEAKAEPL
jgi:hypothetical protein